MTGGGKEATAEWLSVTEAGGVLVPAAPQGSADFPVGLREARPPCTPGAHLVPSIQDLGVVYLASEKA